jgi:hypothetical protein
MVPSCHALNYNVCRFAQQRFKGGSDMRLLRLALVIMAFSIGLFAAESPFSGTWKLNVAKSKMAPPSPQAETVRVDADDNGIKVSDDITDAKGQPMKVSYDAKFDGKDYPATGSPAWDSVSFQRVNASTLKAKTKKGGTVVGEYTITVSQDGKIITVKYTETGPEGKPVKGSAVYDKQ